MDRRTKFWQDNFSVLARGNAREADVNIYGARSWELRKGVFSALAGSLCAEGVLGPGKLAADIGCGSGMFSRIIASTGSETVAVDLCPEMAKRAAVEDSSGSLMLVNADCERLPFPDATFDFVAANGLVNILSDPRPFLRELGRILKPGGTAMIETLNSLWLGRIAFAFSSSRELPPDIGVLHYLPGALSRSIAKEVGTDFICTIPIVRLGRRLAALEPPLQKLAWKLPFLALPFSSAFILLAVKSQRSDAGIE